MSDTPKAKVVCPKCASADVRYSYTQSKWDAFLDLLFSMDAFRCRSCRARFHKYDAGGDEEEEEDVVERPRRRRGDDQSHS
jgi:hypothetical protein